MCSDPTPNDGWHLDKKVPISIIVVLLTQAAAVFTPADCGKNVVVVGCGAGGTPLAASISTWNSATQVALNTPALTTAAGQALYMDTYPYTDDGKHIRGWGELYASDVLRKAIGHLL